MSLEWIPEHELAQQLGVPRAVLRNHRLSVESGVVRTEGKLVLWRKSAAAALYAALGLGHPAEAEKTSDGPLTSSTEHSGEELTVSSSPRADCYGRHYDNWHVIRATRKNGDAVVVRVGDSAKWTPKIRTTGRPMTFRAQRSQSGNWWVPMGREPRYVGAW